MKGEYHRLSLWLAGAMLVLGGLYYFFVHRQDEAEVIGQRQNRSIGSMLTHLGQPMRLRGSSRVCSSGFACFLFVRPSMRRNERAPGVNFVGEPLLFKERDQPVMNFDPGLFAQRTPPISPRGFAQLACGDGRRDQISNFRR